MVRIEINPIQLKKAITQLSLRERAKLVEALQRQTWAERFRQLLARIDTRLKKTPPSQKEINKIVGEARKEYYAKSRC